jgi:hypothetical protein
MRIGGKAIARGAFAAAASVGDSIVAAVAAAVLTLNILSRHQG